MIEPNTVPHRAQLGAQLPWLEKAGHPMKAGESLPAYLERLDSEEVITLLSREGSTDSATLKGALYQAEKSGRLLVLEPRAALGRPQQTLQSVDAADRVHTLTRAQAKDPALYRAARAASIKAGNGPIPNIVSG